MKNDLRKKYKSLRAELSNKTIENLSIDIVNNLISNFDLTQKHISVFLPIKKLNEVNTWHLINQIKANYYLPVVKNKTLVHIKYLNKQQLISSSWGIDEPTYGTEVSPNLFDFVIVPLLAYDLNGNRVGYGAGFYDDFLKKCKPKCKFIGVSFFNPESLNIKPYLTDIPLHFCVTPKKVFKF